MKQNPYNDMDEKASHVAYLIAGFIRQMLTEKEHIELDDWVNESDSNMQLFEELTDEDNLVANLAWMDKVQTKKTFEKLQQKEILPEKPGLNFKLNYVTIAATVFLITGLFFIYRFTPKNNNRNATIDEKDTAIKPGGNRATLTINNNKTIDLLNVKNGLIQNKDGNEITKLKDGELIYSSDSNTKNTVTYNNLTTPVGGQYMVQLQDGTKVWLNAATTLKYPSVFTGIERAVELSGEAYFEVAKNEQHPFKVYLKDSTGVAVLGTHFNIMAYPSETTKEITLLEGSVLVSNQYKNETLSPGMQIGLMGSEQINKPVKADVEEVTGWKNGLFIFHDADIITVMKQVERWYDIKVVYSAKIVQAFNAVIARNEPVSKLLHLLEQTGYVHFKIKDKTIYVLP